MTNKHNDKHALEWLKAYSTTQDTSALQKSQEGTLSRQQSGIPKPSAEARTIQFPFTTPAYQLSLPLGLVAVTDVSKQTPRVSSQTDRRDSTKLADTPPSPAPNTHVVQCWDVETKMRWSFAEKSLGDAMRTAEKQRAMGPNVRAEVNVAPPPKRETARRPVSEPSPLSAPKRRAKESDGEGRKKEPPGHVHWVSERWTQAWRRHTERSTPDPHAERIVLHGVHIVSSNGELWGGMPQKAQMAIIGKRKKQHDNAKGAVLARGHHFVGWPVRVTLTRVAPTELDEDNLHGAFKYIRDGITEALGFRDDKRRGGYLDWQYRQQKGGTRATKTKAAYSEVIIDLEVLT